MPDDSNPADVPPGNPPPSPPAGGNPPPPAASVDSTPAAGNPAGDAGGGVLGSAGGGGVARPPKPKKGPGRGNTWVFDASLGDYRAVPKTEAPLDAAARKVLASVGWGGAGEPPGGSESPARVAPSAPVPVVFAFDEAGNRAFLEYALDTAEDARLDHLKALALSLLAGSKAESRADEFAERFYGLEKLTEREREGVIVVLLEFLRDCEVNIPKSAYGVWAICNRSWRGYRSQKEMVKELTAVKEAAK